ncbi:GSCOCG00001064001-RA-CDS, partial [Cotesia congregata]
MMQYNKFVALCLVAITLGQAASLPQHPVYHPEQYAQQQVNARDERKFAEKPNAMKKVALDDIDDIGSNQLQETNGTGFSWSNMLGMVMQMLLGPTGSITGPSKNDIDDGAPSSPWANLLTMGLRVLTAILGGNQQADGIDKVDHSPMQGYMRSMKSFSNVGRMEEEGQRGCAERALCEASAECVADSQGTSMIFCQLGSYATSYLLQRQSGVGFEALFEAGRRGRSGEDCRTLFMDCNASLFNWGGSGGHFKGPYVPLERWQSGWEHPHHSHGHSHGHHGGGGKGGSGAALSALALLAFLFFINCMQQSLNDNTTASASTTTTALLVRDDDDFIS